MPSRRPLRTPGRLTDATLLATWRDGTVHLWGWDGHQTMPLAWLDRARWVHGAHSGRFSSLDIPLPDGRTIEAATHPARQRRHRTVAPLARTCRPQRSARLARPRSPASPTRRSAPATVTPTRRDTERDVLVARWLPVSAPIIDEALEALAASMPPIVLPDPTDPTTVADIHATLVDSVARHRLAVGRWRPSVTGRAPAAAATRAVFRALSTGDPRVSTGPHDVAVGTIATTLDRRRRRAGGEPVVVPRLRLVVPDELGEDWEVRLELVDELDPGRWCSADDVWDSTPMAVELAGSTDHLDVLGSELATAAAAVAARIDALEPLARPTEPSSIELDLDAADRFLEQAPAELERLGIELIGPERLVRANLAVRGTVAAGNPTEQRAGFNRDAVVDWRLVVADGDDSSAVSAAELARADAAGATLLHTGRRWVRIDPAALRKARQRLDEHTRQHAVVDAVTLLHLAAAGELDAPERRDRTAVERRAPGRAARRPARRGARGRAVRRRAASVPAPRPGLAALPRPPRTRRLPGRRHGARQDGHHAGPPPVPARSAPRRVSAVGRPQLVRRGSSLHPGPARRRRTTAPTATSDSTGSCR